MHDSCQNVIYVFHMRLNFAHIVKFDHTNAGTTGLEGMWISITATLFFSARNSFARINDKIWRNYKVFPFAFSVHLIFRTSRLISHRTSKFDKNSTRKLYGRSEIQLQRCRTHLEVPQEVRHARA